MEYTFEPVLYCEMCQHTDADNKTIGFRLNRSQRKPLSDKRGIAVAVVKCGNCGYLYTNPQPVLINPQTKFAEKAENYWKPNEFTVDEKQYITELTILKKYNTKSAPETKVLDIGFGLGKTIHVLKQNNFDVYGIEPFTSFFNYAVNDSNFLIDKTKVQNISFENAHFEKDQFDFIIFEAFQHLAYPDQGLKKALEWLKPGGLIQIEVANSNWFIAKLLNAYYKIRGTSFVTNLSPMHAPFNQHEFTLNTFEENAKLNNYKIIHADFYVCNPYFPSLLGKLASYYMKKTNSGMQLSVWLQKL